MELEELIEPKIEIKQQSKEEETRNLILYNDDFNTFEHVIISLIQICGHNPNQAEQCAMIVHNNGKCSVKSGSLDKLKPMAKALGDRNITVDIE
jgi:ATP-dependent Clp protease adaptor protein ClpS